MEGLLPGVAADVALQVALLVEALGAQVARVGPLARVALHVPGQVHLLAEGHAAHAAAELPVHRPPHRAALTPGTLPGDCPVQGDGGTTVNDQVKTTVVPPLAHHLR